MKPELKESFRKEMSEMWQEMTDCYFAASELEVKLRTKRERGKELEDKILDQAQSNGIAGCSVYTGRGFGQRHANDCLARIRRFVKGEIDFDGNEMEAAPK